MENIKEEAKEKGYVETLFHRRRYIPELKSNNYMVRQFGERAAMNTPIQGTAADIMKIAMIKVFKEIEKRGLKSKIVLQVHDEMMIEAVIEEREEVKEIVKESMETAAKLKVPLIAEFQKQIIGMNANKCVSIGDSPNCESKGEKIKMKNKRIIIVTVVILLVIICCFAFLKIKY